MLALAPATRAASGPVRLHGYLTVADGTALAWSVILPSRTGRFPVLMEYDGYSAGSKTAEGLTVEEQRFLADGYAVLGLNVRGSGCSGGVFDVLSPVWARDGATAVEWAARQSWSTGDIGMYGVSFAGYMQLWVAAERPPHLRAIAPGGVVADPYRDVGYPGGIQNTLFPSLWWAILNQTWTAGAPTAVQDGDQQCLRNIADHPAANAPYAVPLQLERHPTYDAWMRERSLWPRLSRVNVPTFAVEGWQDEQVGSRAGYYTDLLQPSRTWVIQSNGGHGSWYLPGYQRDVRRFFARFVKREPNRFDRTPHLRIWHETQAGSKQPRWVDAVALPQRPRPVRFWFGADGQLVSRRPAQSTGMSYRYPVLGAAMPSPLGVEVNGSPPPALWWGVPSPPEGSLSFTSDPLRSALSVAGPASADLWVSTTATDTDLQVTLTEVRPDGQEVYLQRGWLRLSHRSLDRARSTTTRPWHPYTAQQQRPVAPGKPVLARVEVNKFAHVFRAGSRLRIWVDAPSTTGLWQFKILPDPATNTVHVGGAHPSSLVLGALAGTGSAKGYPACGSVLDEPCRRDPVAP